MQAGATAAGQTEVPGLRPPFTPSCVPSAILPNAFSGQRQSACERLATSYVPCGPRLKRSFARCGASLPSEPVGQQRCGHALRRKLFLLLDDDCSFLLVPRVRE